MWVPPENTDPFILHHPTRRSVGFYGAVCENDGRLATMKAKKFNAETFHEFIKVLIRRRRKNRKIVVILDNARWHHAKLLKPWLNEHRDILELDFLPPYSPELNTIERMWKVTRRLCTHNQYFEEMENLVLSVRKQFDLWKKPNETLKRLCAVI